MLRQTRALYGPTAFNPYPFAVTYKWFTTATVVILVALDIKQTSPLLVALVAVYNSLFSILGYKFRVKPEFALAVLGLDFIVCASLIYSTGVWASPYFQYGLSFLILASLLFGFKGAVLSVILYGTTYFIGLQVDGLGLDSILTKGYLESFVMDYAIFVLVGLSAAFIARVLSSFDAQALMSEKEDKEGKPSIKSLNVDFQFTPQEEKVARLLVGGRTNMQIASELGISVNTVKSHVKNIYQKLEVKCRSKAIYKLVNATQTQDD